MHMGKTGVTLPAATVRIYRRVFEMVLAANDDFNTIISAAIKGLTGAERQKKRLKEINRLILKNDAFRDDKTRTRQQLATGEHRT